MSYRKVSALLAGIFWLAGCSTTPAVIPVNSNQTLVMEANLLAAGISANEPTITGNDMQASARAELFNESAQPVAVHYRYYWYDSKGLEMHPLEPPRTIMVPAHGGVSVFSSQPFVGAHQVRLYVYL